MGNFSIKSAIGPSFFALAHFCGDWKDAGKPARAQTNRTGIKRARVHMLVCHGGNSLLLGLDALEVADPAPSQKPCLLVKGGEWDHFYCYATSVAPATSSPIVMPAGKSGERMRGSLRAHFSGGMSA